MTDKQTERQTNRERERDRKTEREREKDTETERQTQRQREAERDTPSRGEVGGVKNSSTNKADIEGKANFSDTAVLLPQTSHEKANGREKIKSSTRL